VSENWLIIKEEVGKKGSHKRMMVPRVKLLKNAVDGQKSEMGRKREKRVQGGGGLMRKGSRVDQARLEWG